MITPTTTATPKSDSQDSTLRVWPPELPNSTTLAEVYTILDLPPSLGKDEEGELTIAAAAEEVTAETEKLLVLGGWDSFELLSTEDSLQSAMEVDLSPNPRPVPPCIIVPLYVTLSGGIILFNKYIYTSLNFPYPVFLTAYHMAVAMIGSRVLNMLPFARFKLRSIGMTSSLFARTILPLSLLFSGSLIFSNIAYLHLSISVMQMLKAFIPILVLVFQILAGIQKYNHLLLSIVLATMCGCIIAAMGEMRFSMIGFTYQAIGIVVEASRTVLVQVMLREMKMDPLSSIAMYAPICVILISGCLPFFEGLTPFHNIQNIGIHILLLNGLHAFALNVTGILLIDSAGSLVSTLSGIVKDIVLIAVAHATGTPVTFKQVFGYSIVLTGLFVFRFTSGDPMSPSSQKLLGVFSHLSVLHPIALFYQYRAGDRLATGRMLTLLLHRRKIVVVSFWVAILVLSAIVHNVMRGATESTWPSLPSTLDASPEWSWQTIREHFAGTGDFFADGRISAKTSSRSPKGSSFSAAVVYLTGGTSSRTIDTIASMETLARYMPFKRPYPILLMHNGDLADPVYQQAFLLRWTDRIEELRNVSEKHVWKRMEAMRAVIEFVQVDLIPPEDAMRMGLHDLAPVFSNVWPGYHSMCRFYATQIFKHPRLRDLDFYMRMDSDSFIPEIVPYDPIDLAFERNLKYLSRVGDMEPGYGADPGYVTHGLFDFVEDFVRPRDEIGERLLRNNLNIPPRSDERAEADFPVWYNNFEIVHVPSFQRPDVVEWLDHLEDYWLGFYQYRWGDAPLRRVTTAMFFEPEDVRLLCSWTYHHQATFTPTCSPEEDLRLR